MPVPQATNITVLVCQVFLCNEVRIMHCHYVDKWDCIATCYFMDTAHNIITYLENIYSILKPGGYWVNFGEYNYFLRNINPGCDCNATTSIKEYFAFSCSSGFVVTVKSGLITYCLVVVK